MNVLISGAGIAGPCLAYWLQRHGINPTIVERAPQPRTGGYIIDFWGAGFDVADRMGLIAEIPDDIAEQKALLRRKLGGAGWECPGILDALDRNDGLYMDRVSQIRMDSWTLGRVALIGDAAFCVSLLGGQGSALAMVAAYVLAGELKRANGDHEVAFRRHRERPRAFIGGKQKAALKFASFFSPRSRFGIFLGNQIMKLMGLPLVAEFAVGREIRDTVELPKY